jgi:serine/threonine protein kinase
VEFSTKDLIRWSFQIACGMEYLDSKHVASNKLNFFMILCGEVISVEVKLIVFIKVIHGDLACRNILLGGGLVAKISDFGLSRQLANYTSYVKTSQVRRVVIYYK